MWAHATESATIQHPPKTTFPREITDFGGIGTLSPKFLLDTLKHTVIYFSHAVENSTAVGTFTTHPPNREPTGFRRISKLVVDGEARNVICFRGAGEKYQRRWQLNNRILLTDKQKQVPSNPTK